MRLTNQTDKMRLVRNPCQQQAGLICAITNSVAAKQHQQVAEAQVNGRITIIQKTLPGCLALMQQNIQAVLQLYQ